MGVLFIVFAALFAGVIGTLLHYGSYRNTGSFICFGYCKYPMEQLYLYRFDVSKRLMRSRGGKNWRVRVAVYRDGALVREHWLAPWTNGGIDKLHEKVARDLQPYGTGEPQDNPKNQIMKGRRTS